MFAKMKLGKKIGGGFFVVLVLTGVIALTGWFGLDNVVQQQEQMSEIDAIVKQFLNIREENKSYIITADKQNYEKAVTGATATPTRKSSGSRAMQRIAMKPP